MTTTNQPGWIEFEASIVARAAKLERTYPDAAERFRQLSTDELTAASRFFAELPLSLTAPEAMDLRTLVDAEMINRTRKAA